MASGLKSHRGPRHSSGITHERAVVGLNPTTALEVPPESQMVVHFEGSNPAMSQQGRPEGAVGSNHTMVPETQPEFQTVCQRKSSRTPLDGCEAFRVVTNECPNLLEPGSIRTSALRRYLATTSQILDMKPEELKMLCDHMGHDVNIHINHYRLQSSLLEKSKVARLLIAVENGQVKDFKGKNLDDIEIDTLPLHSAQFDEAENSDTTSGNVEKLVDSAVKPVCASTSTISITNEPIRNVVIRKRWSDEENTVFFNIMKDYIESKKMPPASKIREVCDKLKGRTTAQIRSRVHNYITGKQKCVV
ncbi:uncharacterized protein LOC141914151 [Tubulanus polymorphus]|uniref:uncharacterized protein LOC141914151 n=1 Tax=Tubulanus polymorphus TaxID=672921 RepID=UPI003DA3C805